jgi:hypothetical protein
MQSKQYQSGSPVYYGDPTRLYSSELIVSVNVSMVKSPDGSKKLTGSDEQLIAAMRKLKFGQIGAVKSGVTVSSSETLVEILTPVTMEEVVTVEENLKDLFNLDDYMSKKTIIIDEKPVTLADVKDHLSQYRAKNADIRKEWQRKAELLRDRGVKSDAIISAKEQAYSEYVSVTEYGMAMSIVITHYVQKPSIKGYVIENCSQEHFDAYNYKEGKVRKTATYRGPVVSIPIQTLVDRDSLLQAIKALIAPDRLKGVHPKAEQLIIESSPINSQSINFDDLRRHDSAIVTKLF